MAKATQTSDSQIQEKNPNQFGLGLLLGFFVGSTSYFLFKTDEGQELKESFVEKWQQAANEYPSIAKFKFGDLELEELINILLGKKTANKEKGSILQIKDSPRASKRNKSKSQKKFTGV
jgi:gas vesicle protein